MKLKDLPDIERPRERLIKYGASNLSNEDLISILIRTGSKNENVKEISSKILSRIKRINNLNDLTLRELTDIKGVGETKALTIMAAIELGRRVYTSSVEGKLVIKNSETVNKYFSSLIAMEKQENLLVILLDNKSRLISYKIMFKGTSNSSLVDIKEVFNYAIKERAAAIILMHNHPSGIVSPSNEDSVLTKNIAEAGKILGIHLADHIITNGTDYYSFYEDLVKNEA